MVNRSFSIERFSVFFECRCRSFYTVISISLSVSGLNESGQILYNSVDGGCIWFVGNEMRMRVTKLKCKSYFISIVAILGHHNRLFVRSKCHIAWMNTTHMEGFSSRKMTNYSWYQVELLYPENVMILLSLPASHYSCGWFFFVFSSRYKPIREEVCRSHSATYCVKHYRLAWLLIKKVPVDVEQLLSSRDAE